ncbi:MAG: EthD domain-containing protein [Deltaproteobacteria bacterium]|nr:EthD domain-containing protein [Deltaproteobacteria bacterium]
MIKLLSVKTRREGSTREAFRRHYEERHVPLGLGFIDRFRWCKYVRNHVLEVRAGRVDFDCLTEFWFASRDDQASTRSFATAPEFAVLDEDDPRFLDVSKRLSFEQEERLVAGERPAFQPPGSRRVSAIFARPDSIDPDVFARGIEAELRRLAADDLEAGTWLSIDRRATAGVRPEQLAVIVSIGSAPGRPPARMPWKGAIEPDAVVVLDAVETPADRLWSGAQARTA